MKSRRLAFSLLPLACAAAAPFAALHCGNGDAPNPIDVDSGSVVVVPPPPTGDAGGDGGDATVPPPSGFYSPAGCPFTVAQETTRPFTAYALDDTTQPADPASAARATYRHTAELWFHVVLRGELTLDDRHRLGEADAFAIPAGQPFTWSAASPDLELLQIVLPARAAVERIA